MDLRRSGRKISTSWIFPSVLLVLLVVLAVLQYRWTGAVSRAEAQRLHASLDSSLGRLRDDLEDELMRPAGFFGVSSEAELGEAFAAWREEARFPELVSGLYVIRARGEAPLELARWEARSTARSTEGGELSRVSRPELEPLLRWASRLRRERLPRFRRTRLPPLLTTSPLALVLAAPRERGAPRSSLLAVVVELSEEVLRTRVLPALAVRHFGADDILVYDVAILAESGGVLFSSHPDPQEVVREADASAQLLGVPRPFAAPRPPDGPGPGGFFREAGELFRGEWQVFVRHRAGSLEAAVARARARNFAVGFGVLLVLGGSVVLMTVSARRATELSERKMEFVAGVSHELRTPLAVIRSAAQNLADGSVAAPEQVKRYGGLLESESRRLEDLVEQVLQLAGVQSQKRTASSATVSAREVVEAAVADSERAARERDLVIETSLPRETPFVRGDADALRRAVANLVANAIKHGGDGNRVSVSLSRGPESEVVISVADRGPGIPRSDLPHLFEAFYRGGRARERQIPGSGLGLSLVQHIATDHGGRVEVESALGKGSRFSIVLPEAEGESP